MKNVSLYSRDLLKGADHQNYIIWERNKRKYVRSEKLGALEWTNEIISVYGPFKDKICSVLSRINLLLGQETALKINKVHKNIEQEIMEIGKRTTVDLGVHHLGAGEDGTAVLGGVANRASDAHARHGGAPLRRGP